LATARARPSLLSTRMRCISKVATPASTVIIDSPVRESNHVEDDGVAVSRHAVAPFLSPLRAL
jgi:hypothetical protein